MEQGAKTLTCVIGCLLLALGLRAEETISISKGTSEVVTYAIDGGDFVTRLSYSGKREPGKVREEIRFVSDEEGEFSTPEVTHGTLIEKAEVKQDAKANALSVSLVYRWISASQVEKAARETLAGLIAEGEKEAREEREKLDESVKPQSVQLSREETIFVRFEDIQKVKQRIKNLSKSLQKPLKDGVPDDEKKARDVLVDLLKEEKRQGMVDARIVKMLGKRGYDEKALGQDGEHIRKILEEHHIKTVVAKALGGRRFSAKDSLEEVSMEYMAKVTEEKIKAILKQVSASTNGNVLGRALALEAYLKRRSAPAEKQGTARPESIDGPGEPKVPDSFCELTKEDMTFIEAQSGYKISTTFKPKPGPADDPNGTWDRAVDAGSVADGRRPVIKGRVSFAGGDWVDWWMVKGVAANDLHLDRTMPENILCQKIPAPDDADAVLLRVRTLKGAKGEYAVGCRSPKGGQTQSVEVFENECPVKGGFPF